MKVGDKIWYWDPVVRGNTMHQWDITYMFDTHTEGFIACLSRPDETKKLGVDRCNASVSEIMPVEPQVRKKRGKP